MMDNRIYADSAQARATDPSAPAKQPRVYGGGFLITPEEAEARHAAKVLREAEDTRRSRERIRGALAQMEEAFGITPKRLPIAV